jgi:hypothetical protein
MAKIVLGFGSSHGPTIATPPDQWDRIVERDKVDPRYDYNELLRNASPSLQEELVLEKKSQRWDACQVAIGKLAGMLAEAKPDVAVVVSNPHGILPDDTMAVFGVFRGENLTTQRAERSEARSDPRMQRYSGPGAPQTGRPRREPQDYKGYPALAEHLIDSMIDEGFDVASLLEYRPELAMDEAFACFYQYYDKAASVPMVPLIVSRYLPSQATPRRCYALGRALRQAIDSWDQDKRVVLMASGGLSHQIIDEELDHQVIEALVEQNADVLCSLPRDRLNRAPGTPETLNWLVVAAAMGAPMQLVEYQPCYRSPAGTGHGVTFGVWSG